MRTINFLIAVAGLIVMAHSRAATSLPDGPGKVLLQNHCIKCHEPQWIEQAEGTETAWLAKIRRMMRRGSDIPANQVTTLAAYLAQALPPRVREEALAASPINTTVGDVSTRPVQTWIRTAGVLIDESNDVAVSLRHPDTALVKVGQRVRAFRIESRSSMYQGQVVSVKPNAAGAAVTIRLKSASQEGKRYLLEIIADRGGHLSVPNEAIIEEGTHQVVYVQRRSGDYVPRDIQTGIKGELFTQVTAGLMEGERVVTFGSFFIDAAFKMKTAAPSSSNETLRIEYQGKPNPPREGSNEVEVIVKQSDGAPLTDGAVSLVYSMAAMPSMNMPEMRNEFSLEHQKDGRYTGHTYFSMTGTWLVTVSVSQGGQPLDEKEFTVIAK